MHDWVLKSIAIDWEAGVTSFAFLPVSAEDEPPVEILIEGLVQLSVPRQFDWGPSVSVLDAYLTERSSGLTFSIQMQSGDLVQAQGSAIRLPPNVDLPKTPTP